MLLEQGITHGLHRVVETLRIPTDVEQMRIDDPREAHAWRMNLRREIAVLMNRGLTIGGFDAERGYLFTAV